MPASIIRWNYDELNQIVQQFDAENARARNVITDVKRHVEVLRGGDWVGEAATKFYARMDGEVLPELLAQVPEPLEQVSADGSYDTRACHAAIAQCQARAAIPAVAPAGISAADTGPAARLQPLYSPGHPPVAPSCMR